MDTINKIYGKRLKEFRLQKKLTQEYIANSVDIRTATISDFENGKTSLKLDTLVCICNVLGISIKDFFDFDSLPKNAQNEELIVDINTYLKNLDIEKLQYIKTMAIMYSQNSGITQHI